MQCVLTARLRTYVGGSGEHSCRFLAPAAWKAGAASCAQQQVDIGALVRPQLRPVSRRLSSSFCANVNVCDKTRSTGSSLAFVCGVARDAVAEEEQSETYDRHAAKACATSHE
ncbi:hypothetical protein MRX96_003118 [Rhipicephalus microplus]